LAVQILLIGIIMFIVPVMAGGFFYKVEKSFGNILFMWISGQIMLWAGFQCICVPVILRWGSFGDVKKLFLGFTAVLAVGGAIICALRSLKGRKAYKLVGCNKHYINRQYIVLWGIFAVLLLTQLILTGVMAYEEGDDAFYVAISTITIDAETMYSKLPYTGGTTGMDARHGLAPFPVWISVLASLSGLPATTVAHIVVPIVLIIMAYAIFYLVGCHLLEKHRAYLPYFMLLVEVMVLFGGYSLYSAENFLLVRTSQGKAVLANLVIPFLFLLFILLMEKIQKKEWTADIWILLTSTMITACLCSTLGALLACMLLGIVGLCIMVCYRKWNVLIGMAFSCAVPVCVAALYFVLG